MKHLLFASAAALLLLSAGTASAQAPTVSTTCGSESMTPGYANGQLIVTSAGLLCTNASGGGGGTGATATAATPTRVEGSTNQPASQNLFGAERFQWEYNGTAVNPNAPALLIGQDGTTAMSASNPFAIWAWGPEAVDAALTKAPVVAGCRASTAAPTAVSADNDVQAIRCDLNGNTISRMAPLANAVSGFISTPMTVTTSTLLLAAPGSGLRNYITHVACYNADTADDTLVNLQDGSGGTAFYQVDAPKNFGGSSLALAFPVRQPTTNTAVYVVNTVTGASTTCVASGFKAGE